MQQAATLDPDGWIKRPSLAELEAKQLKAHERRKARGELSRLSRYMNQGGGLVRDEIPGVGVVYRAHRVCTVAPFSPTAVETWCVREGRELPK